MIPQIKEINFPSYATISTATATLSDMGERTISAQVKIDGAIKPDFTYDWEVEFQGERYIHPVREPQASKGNDSICSTIDLTFQHWTIYQLKRYYYVTLAPIESGTAVADKYIAPLNGNLKTFCENFQGVLKYYYGDDIKLVLNPNLPIDEQTQYMEISYTHIWDVLQKLYEVYGVRWAIKGNLIGVGYDAKEVSHIFEYGFDGGLLRVERQVQSTDIRNSLLGRGGDKNLPYRYFKDVDAQNPSFPADPDWIPELANVYFSELRGKSFRDYVKGWKAKHYKGEVMANPTEAYTKGYNDEKFNPIEYVEDEESIAKYGLLQGGLENQESIYPTIQGVEVDGLGRIDEVVAVEQVLVDPSDEPTTNEDMRFEVVGEVSAKPTGITSTSTIQVGLISADFTIPEGYEGRFTQAPIVKANANVPLDVTDYRITKGADGKWKQYEYKSKEYEWSELNCQILEWGLYESGTNNQIKETTHLPSDKTLEMRATIKVSGFMGEVDSAKRDEGTGLIKGKVKTPASSYPINVSISRTLDYAPFYGEILANTQEDGFSPIEQNKTLYGSEKHTFVFTSKEIIIPEEGATIIDAPVRVTTNDKDANVEYKRQVEVISRNEDNFGESVSSINIPQGKYYVKTSVEVTLLTPNPTIVTASLLPTWIAYASNSTQWIPTFDIWVKNIWGSVRHEEETDEQYAERVWRPILGDKQGNEAKVVFTTGMLSGKSDWEFVVNGFAYDNSALHNGVQSEWRLTLAKTDAELEATGLYIPNASTGGNAIAGDKFFFLGIDMPHQYVLWAEQRLDDLKRDTLLDTANIKPTWVVQTDKVRLHELQDGESELLLDSIKVGNLIKLQDSRFIDNTHESLYIQSVTYSWQSGDAMLPEVEVVLSDKVSTVLNPVAQIQGQVDALSKQVGGLGNVQQVVSAMGDARYLRKDGQEAISASPTRFRKEVSSENFRQGMVGGSGWGMYTDENGNSVAEFDVIKSRKEFQVNNLVVNQITTIGGKEILSAANMVVSRVADIDEGFKCYLDTHNLTIGNLFVVDDIAYSQMFDEQNSEIKYYKRKVVEVGDNYLVLSRTEVDGDGAPQVGDVIAQFGNYTDKERQYVIIRDVIGGGYEQMLSGLNSVTSRGSEYYFAGKQGDKPARWFVGDANAYAQYQNGVFKVKGQLEVGSQVGSGMTIIDGGSILSETITLQQDGSDSASGISGVGDQPNSVRFWSGGVPKRWYAWVSQENSVYYTTEIPKYASDIVEAYQKVGGSVYGLAEYDGEYLHVAVDLCSYTPSSDILTIDGDTSFLVTNDGTMTAKGAILEQVSVSGRIEGELKNIYEEVRGTVTIKNTPNRNFTLKGNTTIYLPTSTSYLGTTINIAIPKVNGNDCTLNIMSESGNSIATEELIMNGEFQALATYNTTRVGFIQLVCIPPLYSTTSSVIWVMTQNISNKH